jgi:hypothetical protein
VNLARAQIAAQCRPHTADHLTSNPLSALTRSPAIAKHVQLNSL